MAFWQRQEVCGRVANISLFLQTEILWKIQAESVSWSQSTHWKCQNKSPSCLTARTEIRTRVNLHLKQTQAVIGQTGSPVNTNRIMTVLWFLVNIWRTSEHLWDWSAQSIKMSNIKTECLLYVRCLTAWSRWSKVKPSACPNFSQATTFH